VNDRMVQLVRAVRGPVVLMTVGGLFAASQMGGYGFQQTWPTILIVIGVLKLFEHLAARSRSGSAA
jgi:hypothetical protein